jgi:hypothetical protein
LVGAAVVDGETIVFLNKDFAAPPFSRFDDMHVKSHHVITGDREKLADASPEIDRPHTAASTAETSAGETSVPMPPAVTSEPPFAIRSSIKFKRGGTGSPSTDGGGKSPGRQQQHSSKGDGNKRGKRKGGDGGGSRPKESADEREAKKDVNLKTRIRRVLYKAASVGSPSLATVEILAAVNATKGGKLTTVKQYLAQLERLNLIHMNGGSVQLLQHLKCVPESWVSPDKAIRRKLERDEAARFEKHTMK